MDGRNDGKPKTMPLRFSSNNRTAIGHCIVTLYWYSGRIVYRYLHVTSIVSLTEHGTKMTFALICIGIISRF